MEVTENQLQDRVKYPEAKAMTKNGKHIVIYPNAKQGQDYRAVLYSLHDPCKKVIGYSQFNDGNVELECSEGLSLNCRLDQSIKGLVIEGHPEIYGTFDVTMKLKREKIDFPGTLIVNPDPRKLWKNIPTPEDIEYYKQDSVQDFIVCASSSVSENHGEIPSEFGNNLNVVAASMRGRSHAHEGKPRDDHFAIQYFNESRWVVAVVADGAGSAKFSRQGSKIACDSVLSVCKDYLENHDELDNFLTSIFKEKPEAGKDYITSIRNALSGIFTRITDVAKDKIREECGNRNDSVTNDFSTTLLITICKRFNGFWFVASFGIGDGIICIQKENGLFKQLSEPDSGEYAGQTRFITSSEVYSDKAVFENRIKFDICSDFKKIYLMTDGISDAFFETDANLKSGTKWRDFVEDLNKSVDFSNSDLSQVSSQLLEWLNFWSTGNHDDRTIAVIY